MTVPGACKDSNVVAMKKVEGEPLRREESYAEAAPCEANLNVDDDDDGVERMYSLKRTDSSRHPKMAEDMNCYYANSSPALRRNVRAWCDATGLPTTIAIRCKDRVFHLHKVRDSLLSN